MVIKNQVSTKAHNTMGINTQFSTLIEVDDKRDLLHLDLTRPMHILGGGSNVLITQGMDHPVLLVSTKGIAVVKEDESSCLVQVAAGESWHELVLWSLKNNLGGIENLALIPGKCGAAPMQNIGAYGVEIKDVLHSVEAIKKSDSKAYVFHNAECGFGYRTSNFKTVWKDKFIITDLTLRLSKAGHHKVNLSYGAISKVLAEKGIVDPSIIDVAQTVISIRESKLPDPAQIGNAGSFFKNPILSPSKFKQLQTDNPGIPHYPQEDGNVKVPAGWLIDQCGWKGKRLGEAGVYKNQALVLVNHGAASGEDIYALSESILTSVNEKYGIVLEREVNLW